jgi:hypothetical protein
MLVQQREAAEVAIANVRTEKAKVDGERKVVEADLGPVRYLATRPRSCCCSRPSSIALLLP